MKKRILFVFFLMFLLFPLSLRAADLTNQYQDAYDAYRKSYDSFSSAKEQYIAYHSLTAQTDLISTTKTFFTARANIVSIHLTLLEQKLQSATGYNGAEKQKAAQPLQDRVKVSLKQQTDSISKASSLDQLLVIDGDFKKIDEVAKKESKIGFFNWRTSYDYQLVSVVKGINTEVKAKVLKIKNDGGDVVLLESWTGEIDKRVDQINEDLKTVKSQLLDTQTLIYDSNLEKKRATLDNIDQSLKQIDSYFNEIVSGMENVHRK